MKYNYLILIFFVIIVFCALSSCNKKPEKEITPKEDTTLFKNEINEKSIKISDLPKEVKIAVKEKYPDGKILAVYMLDNGLDKTYRLELDNRGEQLKINISEDGTFLEE